MSEKETSGCEGERGNECVKHNIDQATNCTLVLGAILSLGGTTGL